MSSDRIPVHALVVPQRSFTSLSRVSSASASNSPPPRATEADGILGLREGFRCKVRLASLAPSEGLSEHRLNPAPELSSQRCGELQLRDSGQGQGSRVFVGESGPLGGGVGVGGETDQGRAGAADRREVAER